MEAYIWLALIVIGIIIEVISPQLISIWCVFGFIGALIASYFGADLWLQITIAIVISVVSLILTKPLVKKMLKNKNESTNADRHIGKTVLVSSEISEFENKGRVTVDGISWVAFSENGKTIKEGTKVVIKAIRGNKLCVEVKN